MKMFLDTSAMIVAFTLGSVANAVVPNLTAAELAAHRIEKFVTLKKIDLAFQSNFRGLEVVNIPSGGVAKPTFQVIVSQEVDPGNVASRVELILDEKGKALGPPTVTSGVAALKPTVWSGKDPLTLTELALHQVEDLAGAGDKKIAQFIQPLRALRISKVGQNAEFEVLANGIKGRLVMHLDGQGKLIHVQVVE